MWRSSLKKILLIDNTFDPPHGCPEIRYYLEQAAKEFGEIEITTVRGPDQKIPKELSGFDGVVISGSKARANEMAPWIDLELEAIRDLHALKIPSFGICYGEQMMARALGGIQHVAVAKQSEHGWAELELKGDSPLFEGLPKKFHTYEFHSDEVVSLPPNFRLTASNKDCPIQAFDVVDAPMWGVQFHPERGLEKGDQDLDKRLQKDPKFRALNRECSKEVYNPEIALTIFRNFFKQVWRSKE